jgi:hypothetical protein
MSATQATSPTQAQNPPASHTAVPAFYNSATGKAKQVAGIKATTFDLTPEMKKLIDTVSNNSTYGGFFADGLQVAPADLKAAIADPNKLKNLIAGGAGYLDSNGTVTNMKLEELTRGTLFESIYKVDADMSGSSWGAQAQTDYKAALRAVVESMLSSPNTRVYHWSGDADDDWGTDAWLAADTHTGALKILVHDGDM